MRGYASPEEDSETKFSCRKFHGGCSWDLWGNEESRIKLKEKFGSDVVRTKAQIIP